MHVRRPPSRDGLLREIRDLLDGLLGVGVFFGGLLLLALAALTAFFLVLVAVGTIARAVPGPLPEVLQTLGILLTIALATGLPVAIVVLGYRGFRRRLPDRWRGQLEDERESPATVTRATDAILAEVRDLDARFAGATPDPAASGGAADPRSVDRERRDVP